MYLSSWLSDFDAVKSVLGFLEGPEFASEAADSLGTIADALWLSHITWQVQT